MFVDYPRDHEELNCRHDLTVMRICRKISMNQTKIQLLVVILLYQMVSLYILFICFQLILRTSNANILILTETIFRLTCRQQNAFESLWQMAKLLIIWAISSFATKCSNLFNNYTFIYSYSIILLTCFQSIVLQKNGKGLKRHRHVSSERLTVLVTLCLQVVKWV